MNYGTVEELTEPLDDITKLYVDALTGCVDSMIEFIALSRIPPSGSVYLSDYLRVVGHILEHRDEVIHDTLNGDVWMLQDLVEGCINVAEPLRNLYYTATSEEKNKDGKVEHLHEGIAEMVASSAIGLINRYIHPVGVKLDELSYGEGGQGE